MSFKKRAGAKTRDEQLDDEGRAGRNRGRFDCKREPEEQHRREHGLPQIAENAVVDRRCRNSNKALEPYLRMLVSAIKNTEGIRRAGSAALDLCYVAAGRLDAYWETGLSIWDLAAGVLIVREAGGIVSGLDGSEDFLDTGHILTGTPKIYAELAKLFGPDIKEMFAK